ncbi:MAG: CHAT domain-containing protein [Micropruina sp.]|uniref:CHAT domain-containing protein n=1 Tax=Micropruina sp. TaxID=2737536 RepID=UPI0039E5CC07
MTAARTVAEKAVRAVDQKGAAAVPQARRTVARLATADPAAQSIAHRALGHGLISGGSLDEAVGVLQTSVRLAQRSGERVLVGEARLKLAHCLLISGKVRRALNTVDAALDDLAAAPVPRARAWGTRALIQRELGDFDAALADFDAAISGLRELGDALGLQRALINRAITRIDTLDTGRAFVDLLEADAIAAAGHPAAAGTIAANLGYAASVAGDVPEALIQYRRALRLLRQEGSQLGSVLADRGSLLIGVGLADEAFADLAQALEQSISEGRTLRMSELRLLLASAADQLDDPATAYVEAARALRGFRAEQRPVWAASARLAMAGSALRIGRTPRWRSVAGLAETLVAAGWVAQAIEAWLLVASLAPAPHRTEALGAAAAHRSKGPALVRARGWYAQALLDADRPDRARRAVRRGLAILDDHLIGVGADELRAGMARHRLELAGLGVDLALSRGRPAEVFDAVERARATVLVRDAVRPPTDPELAELLRRYRAAGGQRERTTLAARIRDRSRTARGAGELVRPVRMSEVDAGLGDAALITWFARDQRLHALTRVAGRTRLHHLGAEQPLRSAVDRLSFAMHRLAAEGVDHGRFGHSLHRLLDAAAAGVQAALITPLPELGGRELVLIPPAFLHQVPWHELPALTGRPLIVASSVRQWRRADTAAAASGRVLVAAGPGLPGARREAEAVAAGYRVTPLLDPDAGVQRVLDALADADLAHLAAHGWLRPDNPQFSELTMSDGPLVVHHLDTIARLPSTLILASCDSGRPVSRPGEALLGFAAACLIRGTRTLIAPVTPVPDGGTETAMTRLHAGLAAGKKPAVALADAQADQPSGHRAFVCLGAS